MEEGTGIATVTGITKHPIVEVAEGVEIRRFTARAEMHAPAHKYSKDLFLVRILKPAALGSHQLEPGSLMVRGEFEFEAAEEVKVGDRLEISILPATSSQ
jgi:hypothetical protein